MRLPITLAGAALLGSAVLWWMHDTGALLPDSVAVSAAQVAEGRALYARNCAVCHGADLEGAPDWRPTLAGVAPPPHTADGPAARRGDAFLLAVVREGSAAVHGDRNRDGMPGFSGLLDNRQIHSVVAFLKTRWPEGETAVREAAAAGGRAGVR